MVPRRQVSSGANGPSADFPRECHDSPHKNKKLGVIAVRCLPAGFVWCLTPKRDVAQIPRVRHHVAGEISMRRVLAISLLLAVVAVAICVGVTPAEAGVALAGSTAMAVPANAGISAEAQHVINSLEAHFNAIGDALSQGAPEWLKTHVEAAFADVKAKLDEFGAEFAQEFEALKARVTGKGAATSAPPAASAAPPA